jgi:putative transposase
MDDAIPKSDLQFFDPKKDYTVAWRHLPHWAQTGTVCFITWRTCDSLPESAKIALQIERKRLLLDAGIDPAGDWKSALKELPPPARSRLQWLLFTQWDQHLDLGLGECVLMRPELSKIVGESLKHFAGDRYLLTDFVVMPNHVHLLAAFQNEDLLFSQCTSWKRFTARQINKLIGRSDEFWQVEQFDHLIRGPEQFERYREYIANNPRQAGLTKGGYLWYSASIV